VVKRCLIIGIILGAAWSCATVTPTPSPSFYVPDIPASMSTRMTLDQRIAADEVWSELKAGRTAQAQRLILRMGAQSPAYTTGLGYIGLFTSDLTAAETNFKEAIRTSPEMTPALAGLAQVYESKGEKDLLFAEYREILAKDPDNRWARPRYEALRDKLVEESTAEAKAAVAAGNLEEARKAYLKVLTFVPESESANLALARIFIKEKNTAGALPYYKIAIDGQPKNKALLREYADSLFEAGELGRSLDLYEKLAELEPGDAAVTQRIEDLKNKLGVFELPSQYKSIADLDAVTREDLAALIAVRFKDSMNVPERQAQILVDISTSWAQKFIIKVASLGVMSGYDNHTFQPRKIINRAELAETLVQLIDFLKGRGAKFVPVIDVRRIQIADVAPENFYYQPIVRVVSYQIMDLSPQRTFDPEQTVPGREAVRVLNVISGLAK